MVPNDHRRSTDAIDTRRITRRRWLAATAGTVGLSTLAGCSSSLGGRDAGNTLNADVPKGTPASVETKYWHDWPTLDDAAQAEGPPLDYTARAGAPLETLTMEFSSDDDPWSKQHALMMKSSVNALGAPARIIDRPLNQLYAQSWDTPGLENVFSMSTHGPDPVRGIGPNALLTRRSKDSPFNYDNYWHPRINELLDKQDEITEDEQRRADLIQEVQKIFAEDVGAIISLFPDVITAANTRNFEGYVPTPGPGPTRDTFQWTEVNLQPRTGDRSYVKGTTTSMNSLNQPWSAGGAEEYRLKYIYDGLFDASPDLDVIPALATGGGFVDDTTVEVDLRDGVKWHDGKPFTPEDVTFSLDFFEQHSATSVVPFYEPVESTEILSRTDGGRVRFNLTGPDATFMTQGVVQSTVIPKHRWKDVSSPTQYNPNNPVGTGPFKFVDWSQGTRFRVERWDNNWMWSDEFRSKALGDYFESGPGIESVLWVNVANSTAMIGALQSGEIDAVGGVLSNTQADRASQPAAISKMTAKNFAPLDTKLMFSVPLIRDKEFRVALAKAIDKQGFVDTFLNGRATVQGENPISPLLDTWHNPNAKRYGYDRSAARTILRKAGYTWDEEGTIHFPEGQAWAAFVERIQNGNTHKRRTELGQPDFSNTHGTESQ
ncbi:ABC transporter substrate-binding protein [Halococcus dombrowskii]|uniref:ABC transporter substrate-binding protein n=1 Tax=Halococcus dombrowskii TaxID=179637 RepID=A0AAV3SEP0_HALDO|nr:ABC transporter substrate-binding protein [Halococcus dombrowskii]UOO95026.1 ABC transporter substrate-binding protein [Halococcus dombrowskii]